MHGQYGGFFFQVDLDPFDHLTQSLARLIPSVAVSGANQDLIEQPIEQPSDIGFRQCCGTCGGRALGKKVAQFLGDLRTLVLQILKPPKNRRGIFHLRGQVNRARDLGSQGRCPLLQARDAPAVDRFPATGDPLQLAQHLLNERAAAHIGRYRAKDA